MKGHSDLRPGDDVWVSWPLAKNGLEARLGLFVGLRGQDGDRAALRLYLVDDETGELEKPLRRGGAIVLPLARVSALKSPGPGKLDAGPGGGTPRRPRDFDTLTEGSPNDEDDDDKDRAYGAADAPILGSDLDRAQSRGRALAQGELEPGRVDAQCRPVSGVSTPTVRGGRAGRPLVQRPRVTFYVDRWQNLIDDLATFDHVITDPPYSERTHGGQTAKRSDATAAGVSVGGLGYDAITPAQVEDFVERVAPKTSGWFCVFTSHDLIETYERALLALGRYVFAPLACVQRGRNVRLAGDGPANWTDYLIVSRPRKEPWSKWGALPGAYVTSRDPDRVFGGAKPLELMTAIVRDYTRKGDLIFDPFAGSGTTLVAGIALGRRVIGCEANPQTAEIAVKRLAQPVQGDLL